MKVVFVKCDVHYTFEHLKSNQTMNNTYYRLVFTIAILLISISVFSQSETSANQQGVQSLKTQFQEMLDKSESYTDYKVIKKTSLSQYDKAVQDSLKVNRNKINSLSNQVVEQKGQITQLSTRISDLEAQLATSEELRESLVILGIVMNKATYHMIVWSIICGLSVFGVFAYGSFMRSNKITTKSKKELETLEVEYDEHKKNSHEKLIKIGRELQTERNKVEELKSKLKTKSSGNL